MHYSIFHMHQTLLIIVIDKYMYRTNLALITTTKASQPQRAHVVDNVSLLLLSQDEENVVVIFVWLSHIFYSLRSSSVANSNSSSTSYSRRGGNAYDL
mmetsp:Transcript_22287/g.34051  ORF Transcript_22287/g.34051 Transcript_22287/m.34051 type:complete len:98 (+) Transcript_22287:22-315(+)